MRHGDRTCVARRAGKMSRAGFMIISAASLGMLCSQANAMQQLEGHAAPQRITVVDVQTESNAPVLLGVAAAAGLANRLNATVYTLRTTDDVTWLSLLLSNASTTYVTPMTFLNASIGTWGALLYDDNSNNQNATALLPSVVTLAGVLNCVPLGMSLRSSFPNARIVFNSVGAWPTPEAAVQYAVTAGLNATTSLAFQDPALLAVGQLVDWLVSQRIFVMYLNDTCIPFTDDHAILTNILAAAPWPQPVRVYGYNSMYVVFGGDLFEAETNCADTLGQIASANTHNLAFWTHVQPFVPGIPPGQPGGPMVQPPSPPVSYDPSQVYVALVYGDMDNLDFVQSFGRDHMQERAARCSGGQNCFPLTWTLSPNLVELAPAILRWYYATASTTGGVDHFIMPPSGTLYSYPGQMPDATQAAYVQQQNAQARVMDTHGSVHWEWILQWGNAWANYFPRYINTTGTRSFFLNDVPWVIPILDMLNETYRIVGDPSAPETSVVGFRPAFNWQLDGPGGGLPYNASVIAGLINAFEPGTITYIYVIQNTDIDAVFDMVAALDPHVVLVDYQQLTSLAFQHAALQTAPSAKESAARG